MAELKTKAHDGNVRAFLDTIENEKKRREAHQLCDLFETATGLPAVMWGPAIVGFGHYHYKYESGREGDFFQAGFSPRKANFSLYFMPGIADYSKLLENLGKYKTAKSCLYITSIAQIDMGVLAEMIRRSIQATGSSG